MLLRCVRPWCLRYAGKQTSIARRASMLVDSSVSWLQTADQLKKQDQRTTVAHAMHLIDCPVPLSPAVVPNVEPADGIMDAQPTAQQSCLCCCRRGLLAIRGLFGVGAITGYVLAITNMELPNAMVLTFLAPLWVALLSPIILKERLSW